MIPSWRATAADDRSVFDDRQVDDDLSTPISKPADITPLWHRCPPRFGCICQDNGFDTVWPIVQEDVADHPTDRQPTGASLAAAAQAAEQWNRLADGVVVICLADRADRFAAATDRLHAAGLCKMAVFYRPRRPDPVVVADAGIRRAGRFGCWNSHRAVSLASLSAGFQSVLVFEDDFVLLPSPLDVPIIVRQAADCFRSLPVVACDMFLLGGLPLIGIPVWQRLPKLDAFRSIAVCMHAYVARPAFMAKLAATTYIDDRDRRGSERPVDWFAATNCKQVCFSPQFIGQSCSTSSNIVPSSATLITDGTEPADSNAVCSDSDIGLDDRLGPVAVRFARDFPKLYDIIVFGVIPAILLFLMFRLVLRLSRFVFGSNDPPRLTLLAATASVN